MNCIERNELCRNATVLKNVITARTVQSVRIRCTTAPVDVCLGDVEKGIVLKVFSEGFSLRMQRRDRSLLRQVNKEPITLFLKLAV